ncbi:PREDICTED: histone H1-like [Ceratosolen solmsi marchali]|uniref:Histone H1-like n=1 Tax=Ceratosolen solmsi marchali TaxID=326594 RepID=A0AAJ6YXL8_9HYME|nr:PREDICTED: histone H1-like [Ceratosolen solmsi marchali]
MVVSTSGLPSGATLATAKKIAAAKTAAAKKPRAKPSHPPTSDMVEAAIKALKERGGSSLQAIKKYIAATYKVDAEKHSPFIKKYLKSAVASKDLVQVKGKGASGSFKLSVGEGAVKANAKTKRPAAKKSVAKKPISPVKKTVAAKAKRSPVKSLKKLSSPKKAIKTLAAKSPKPKARKSPKLAKKPSKPVARKTVSKVKKSPVKKSSVKK